MIASDSDCGTFRKLAIVSTHCSASEPERDPTYPLLALSVRLDPSDKMTGLSPAEMSGKLKAEQIMNNTTIAQAFFKPQSAPISLGNQRILVLRFDLRCCFHSSSSW
jgi:hypothetical protein